MQCTACLALRAAVFMRMLLLCRTSYAIKTADVLRAPFYVRKRILYSFFLRCDAATQRDRDLCDLHRACFGNHVAHFLFVQINRSSLLKIKNSWAAKSDLCIHQYFSCMRCILYILSISFSMKTIHCSLQSKILPLALNNTVLDDRANQIFLFLPMDMLAICKDSLQSFVFLFLGVCRFVLFL